jgi:hypothetical protein
VPRFTITVTYADGALARLRREEEAMSRHIVDDEKRRDRPHPPSALRVAAGRPRLLCRSSSAMGRGISLVVSSRIRGRRARHIRHRNCGMGYLGPVNK